MELQSFEARQRAHFCGDVRRSKKGLNGHSVWVSAVSLRGGAGVGRSVFTRDRQTNDEDRLSYTYVRTGMHWLVGAVPPVFKYRTGDYFSLPFFIYKLPVLHQAIAPRTKFWCT